MNNNNNHEHLRYNSDTSSSKQSCYTHLQTGDGELCNRLNNTDVILGLHQLTQLVVGLERSQKTTELVVVGRVRQTLSDKQEIELQLHKNQGELEEKE